MIALLPAISRKRFSAYKLDYYRRTFLPVGLVGQLSQPTVDLPQSDYIDFGLLYFLFHRPDMWMRVKYSPILQSHTPDWPLYDLFEGPPLRVKGSSLAYLLLSHIGFFDLWLSYCKPSRSIFSKSAGEPQN